MQDLLAARQPAWWDFPVVAPAAGTRWSPPGGDGPRSRSGARGARNAALLLTDIVDSTGTAARLGDARWANLLQQHDARLRLAVERFGGEVIDLTGDGILATFRDVHGALASAAATHAAVAPLGLRLRAGVHVGEVEVRDARVMGLAVHVTARIAALARPGETLASEAARASAAGALSRFADRGQHVLRGVPQPCHLFAFDLAA